jgi:hypothetical protein
MSRNPAYACIVLPCSADRHWILPQACLGEILTLATSGELPPAEIVWRGELVPVVDFGAGGEALWRDPKTGSGLIAVLLGREGESCRFWAVAVRGTGLGVASLDEEEMEDLPEAVQDYASAAFRLQENVYQVPDLLAIQRAIGAGELTSGEATHVHQLEQ